MSLLGEIAISQALWSKFAWLQRGKSLTLQPNYFLIMEKVKVDKLECHYPALFKVLWVATVVWLLVGIVNYFGHWVIPSKLDGLGMSILFLFAVSVFICFRKGILKLVSKHGILAIDNITRKVASYSFLVSFIVGDIINAVMVSIAAVIIYWYVRMFLFCSLVK